MRRLALLAAMVGALIVWPTGAKANLSLNERDFQATNCTVHVSVTSGTGVPAAETITTKATCGPTSSGLYIGFANLSASDSVSGCSAGAFNDTYPVTKVGPGSCTAALATPGPHKIDVWLSVDTHDDWYPSGCAPDSFDPSYEECNWTFVAVTG
jgi:hypothetical protein